MEPVGITNACTSVVVRNRRSRIVMVHSAIAPRGFSDGGASGKEDCGDDAESWSASSPSNGGSSNGGYSTALTSWDPSPGGFCGVTGFILTTAGDKSALGAQPDAGQTSR